VISKEVREYADALFWKKHRENSSGDDEELRRYQEQLPRGGQRNKRIADNQFNRVRKSIEALTESYVEAFKKLGQIPEDSDIDKITREISNLVESKREQQLRTASELMPRGVGFMLSNMSFSYQGLVGTARQELDFARKENDCRGIGTQTEIRREASFTYRRDKYGRQV
jgi:hypothetical protein